MSAEMPRRGAAYWLWEEEQEARRSAERLATDIEELEAKIVAARQRRADLTLVIVEMAAARGLIESSGLKVEMRNGLPNVSLDKVLNVPNA